MNDHNFEGITKRFGRQPYIQHNRNMNDGIDGVVNYIKKFVKSFPEFSYDVKQVMVDGDLVTIHSHATIKTATVGIKVKGSISKIPGG